MLTSSKYLVKLQATAIPITEITNKTSTKKNDYGDTEALASKLIFKLLF